MNRVFRNVWNAATATWVAAPETACAKRKGGQRLLCLAAVAGLMSATSQAMAAACDPSPRLCEDSGTVTVSAPGGDFDSGNWTFKGTTNVVVENTGRLDNADHRFEMGANLSVSNADAIGNNQIVRFFDTGRLQFSTSNSFSGTHAGIQFGTFHFNDTSSLQANQAGAVGGGSFNFSGTANQLDATVTDAIIGGVFTFTGQGSGNSSATNAIRNATINLNGNNAFTAGAGSIRDTAFSLDSTSTLWLGDQSLTNSSVKLAGSSQLKSANPGTVTNDISVLFASADAKLDVGEGMQIKHVGSENVGDGRILSSKAAAGTSTANLTLTGNGQIAVQNLSAQLRSDAGNMKVQLGINGGNWALQGHAGNNGRIVLNNATASSVGFQDYMLIGPGARVTGLGQYGELVIDGGTFSPGLGTVTINRHFGWADTFEVSARDSDASGSSSRIVTGSIALGQNAKVHVLAENGSWNAQRSYEIVRVNDEFWDQPGLVTAINPANVTANFAYLTPTVSTVFDDANNPTGPASIRLTLARNGSGGTFASQANTPNQRSVANAVENLPAGHAVYNYVETLPVGAPAQAFNSLSGEAHASIASGLPNLTSNAYRLPMANLRHSLNAGLNPAAVTAQVGGTQGSSGLPAFGDKPAWVELVGNWQNVDGDRNTGSLDQHSAGVFAGYDNDLGNGWHLGGALGYLRTDADVSSRASNAEIDSYSATLYGGKAFALDTQRQLNVMAGVSYTFHDIDSERKVRGLGQKLTAGYDAHSTQVFGEVGYLMGQPDGRYIEPFAGLTVSHLDVEGFKEKGGSAALKGDREDDTQVVSTLGVRGQLPYAFGNFGATVHGSLAWQHAFGDEHMSSTMRFVDGSHDFNVRGVSLDRDTAVVGLGTLVNVSANAAISLDYEGRFASGLREHGASLKAQWNF